MATFRRRKVEIVRYVFLLGLLLLFALKFWNWQMEHRNAKMLSLTHVLVLNGPAMTRRNMTGNKPDRKPNLPLHKSKILRAGGGKCKIKSGHKTFSSCPDCFRPNVQKMDKVIERVDTLNFTFPSSFQYVFKPLDEVQQLLVTKYVIMPSEKFLDDCPYLLAVQASVADRRHARDAIRKSWASVAKNQSWPNRHINADVKVIFVLADKQHENITKDSNYASNLLWSKVQEEAEEHDDILYLDMMDGYQKLTLKYLSAFKWVKDYCPCVKFVLKIDQDTFVNVPFLVDTLLYFERRLRFSILGHIVGATGGINPTRRGGIWAVPKKMYPLNRYPPYASGCGYVISMNALKLLVKFAAYMPMFSVEDAFITGVLRMAIGCELFTVGQQMFADWHEPSAWKNCLMVRDEKILGTKVHSGRHGTIWKLYLNGGKQCQ